MNLCTGVLEEGKKIVRDHSPCRIKKTFIFLTGRWRLRSEQEDLEDHPLSTDRRLTGER